MFECFKIRRVSPCFRAKRRASSAIQKQSRERLGMVKTTIKIKQNRTDSQNNEREVDGRERRVVDDDGGRVSEGERLEFGSSAVAFFR
jgi:hypothetical protein